MRNSREIEHQAELVSQAPCARKMEKPRAVTTPVLGISDLNQKMQPMQTWSGAAGRLRYGGLQHGKPSMTAARMAPFPDVSRDDSVTGLTTIPQPL